MGSGFVRSEKVEYGRDSVEREGINSESTVAQKTAPMFAYYIKTHVLLNADII